MTATRLAPIVASIALCGCGSGLYPVEGQVRWKDGSPATELKDSVIIFELPEANSSSQGQIREDATFRLTTHVPDDGALPGEYQVVIIEVGRKPLGGPDSSLMAPGAMDSRFSDFSTSGLTATVKAGENQVTLTVERNAQP